MDEASIFEFENNQIEKGFTNNIILEHLVEYLLNYYSLPINKLNIHLNFGNYDYKVPTNIIANYQRVITAIKKLQNLLYNHNFLKEDLNEIEFSFSGVLCGERITLKDPIGIRLEYNTNIYGYFAGLLANIKYTNLTKLTISFGNDAVENGLLPILPETQITHLHLMGFGWEIELINKIINILPQTKLIDFVCNESYLSVSSVNNLCEILPLTKLNRLHLGTMNIGNIFEKIAAIRKLLELLPFIPLRSLRVLVFDPLDQINLIRQADQVVFLFKRIKEIIPKTSIVHLEFFNEFINENKEIKQLCEYNLKQNKLILNLWYKVFNNHKLKNTDSSLFPGDILKNIISFINPNSSWLYIQSNYIEQSLIVEKSYKLKYLFEKNQLNLIKINNYINNNKATSIEHALRIAAREGDVSIINRLLHSYVNIDIDQQGKRSGKTALHQAVIGLNDKKFVYDPSTKFYHNLTFKIINSYHDCIINLLNAGARLVQDNQGKLPQDYATSEEAVNSVLYLFDYKSSTDQNILEQPSKQLINSVNMPKFRSAKL